MDIQTSDGSYVKFYKNGTEQKRKFENIFEGTYHAAVSLYMQARVRVNFGERPFKHPPPKEEAWKPYKEIKLVI